MAPTTPANFTATGINHGANLSWSAPANPPSAYTISWTGATSSTLLASGTSTSAQINGLTNGGQYTFTLTATNAAGSASATATASLVPPQRQYQAFDNQSNSVTVRSGPGTQYSAVSPSIPQYSNMTLTVHCQALGGSATDGYQTWKTSQVWDQIDWNGGTAWVSDLYVSTPNSAGQGSSPPDPHGPTDFSPTLWQCS
jgi:uncharacterized protein YraI